MSEQPSSKGTCPYARVPLVREVHVDLDTPISAYLKVACGPYSYLLESAEGGSRWGRYSIIGLPCKEVIRVTGQTLTLEKDGAVVETVETADPLAWIDAFRQRYEVSEVVGLPRFTGGLVGYFGYDTIRYIEPRLGWPDQQDPIGTPDILLLVSEEVVVFDNLTGRLSIVVHVNPEEDGAFERARNRLDELEAKLQKPLEETRGIAPRQTTTDPFTASFSRGDFEAAVQRVQDYIAAGDVMQVVLSQRRSLPYRASPFHLYRSLRSMNPSPYMYFLDCGAFQVVGSSPEILVRLDDELITVRPIAGTRPRGTDPDHDLALEEELRADPKELAEHLMLVDLGRNDVGRSAKIGSVRVTEQMVVERYSHVMHLVSCVTGRLMPGLGAADVLRAAFPAGTVTGAPKVRAMEIIDELEPVKRGIYSGAVGYLAWSGDVDVAITIRTAVIKDGSLHLQAGAGIVADSQPAKEWEETMNKGRAIAVAASTLNATA
jgi:anthranilate synthase component 1